MKVYSLKDLKKKSHARRHSAIEAVRRVDPDFYPGKREFDIPRKTEGKQEILDRLKREKDEIFN